MSRAVLAATVLLALVLVGTLARARTALDHAAFDRAEAVGSVRSDPALIYYLCQRVIEAGGGVPGDWRADPRIEHPDTVDVPARFTVGLEWVVAGARAVVGDSPPLHVLCTWVGAALASLTVLGVFLLARELCDSRGWGLFAALLWTVLPASYRTIGFVLVREDLCFPLFALHLALAARAARTGGTACGAAAGVTLGLAAGTWHAGSLLATLELLALLVVFLVRGTNPLATRAGRAALAGWIVVAVAVPALWTRGAVLAPPVQIALALLAASLFGGPRRRVVALGALAVALAGSLALGQALGTAADMRHVAELVWAKLSHLGLRPADPGRLSFEARMMWQGPFATMGADEALAMGGFGLVTLMGVLGEGAWRAALGGFPPREHAAWILLWLAVLATWLVSRTMALPAILLAPLTARGLQRSATGERALAPALAAVALLFLQLVTFGSWLGKHSVPWQTVHQRDALRAMVAAVEEHVPAGSTVVTDFMAGPAVLAHTGRPIALQPKWETAASRERVRAFWEAFYRGSPDDLRALCTGEWAARHLLVDRTTLGILRASRYLAGLREGEPWPAGSAAEALLGEGDAIPPGYVLLARGEDFGLYALE